MSTESKAISLSSSERSWFTDGEDFPHTDPGEIIGLTLIYREVDGWLEETCQLVREDEEVEEEEETSDSTWRESECYSVTTESDDSWVPSDESSGSDYVVSMEVDGEQVLVVEESMDQIIDIQADIEAEAQVEEDDGADNELSLITQPEE